MMKAGLFCLALCAVATPVRAQMKWTDRIFVNANVGVQAGSSDLAITTPFELYDEQGSVASTMDVKGGALFDASAGYKVWRNLAVGVAYTWTRGTSDAAIVALVPDFFLHDAPRTLNASAAGMKGTQHSINLTGTWMVPVTDKIDAGVVFGPTIFNVRQDVPNSVSVTEPGPALAGIGVEKVSKTTVGIHLGVDVTYMLNKRYGVGGLARYTWGSVDFPNASDSVKVGGFQIGAGVRVRLQ